MRPIWSAAQVTNVDADIDYYLTVVRGLPEAVRPHVVLLERDDREPILVIARLVNQRFPIRVGYREIASVGARTLVVAFDGTVGAHTSTDFAEVADALASELDRGAADAVLFQKVELGSPLFGQVRRRVGKWRSHVEPPVIKWTVKLPESWEALLAQRSRQSRRQIRKDDAKFERCFSGRVQVRRLDLPVHRHLLERDLECVARKTYQRALGFRGSRGELRRQLLRLGVNKRWLRAWMVYIDQAPVAFWWGMAYDGVLALDSTGYDPAFAKDRVGYYAMRRMLQDSCSDPDISVVDFGHGDSDFKQRFGTESTMSADVMMFGSRPGLFLLRAGLTANSQLARLASSIMEHTGRAQRLKRRWRARAVAREGAGGPAG